MLCEGKEIINRLKQFFAKVVSVKGLVFGIATWFLYIDKIDQTIWIGCVGIIVGVRAAEKIKLRDNGVK